MTVVLDYIVAHAGHPPTLADIVRDTQLPRATVHAIVAELVDARWLTRRADTGGVGLGPAFLHTARRAVGADRLALDARPAMETLVAQTGAPCFLARRIDDETITVIEYCWPPSVLVEHSADVEWMKPNRPIRLRPPICREFVAWSEPATREAWIASAAESDRARLRAALTEIQSRGFSIERITDGHRAVIDALSALDSVPTALRARVGSLLTELSAIDYLADELTDGTEAGAVTIGAPIRDASGAVVGAIVSCPHTTMSGRQLREWGALTVAAAESVGV
ncbi:MULTISPECIES: helix-turn-helix domain-containing protein [unclassified Gordonia (in: high G+C Gram-positive bacteria)]|uniref:IclR family transcriptional regulator n=1 Tax=unclassified Gordonia (in: high G+C Gram-positive bacteria) TaxID=2657482 RepID=UPI001F0586ED|nr:helix-turn-helix domain-containing protein [Gordonia sp. PDNC005]